MSENMSVVLAEIRKINNRLDSFEGRFDSFERRIDSFEGKFNSFEGRFNSFEGRFNSFEGRFNSFEETVENEFSIVKNDIKSSHETAMKNINSLHDELRIVKDQTMRNSEIRYDVKTMSEKVSDLESDIKLLKKAIAN